MSRIYWTQKQFPDSLLTQFEINKCVFYDVSSHHVYQCVMFGCFDEFTNTLSNPGTACRATLVTYPCFDDYLAADSASGQKTLSPQSGSDYEPDVKCHMQFTWKATWSESILLAHFHNSSLCYVSTKSSFLDLSYSPTISVSASTVEVWWWSLKGRDWSFDSIFFFYCVFGILCIAVNPPTPSWLQMLL